MAEKTLDRVYEPLQVLKNVAKSVWITDGPIATMYGVKFPTRMSVLRLDSGKILVHSPIEPTEKLYAEVEALGPVEALIAPNWIHYLYLQPWAERFPDARRFYAPGIEARAKKEGVEIPKGEPIEGQNPWSPEVEVLLVEGSDVHKEAVLFHQPSRTLILTDLIENFERGKVNKMFVPLAKMAGILAPDGSMPRDMRLTFRRHRDLLRKEIEQMIAWNPERIIIAHGKWFERDGRAELERAFDWVLED